MKLRLASIVAAAAILAGAYPFVQLHIAAQGGGASQVGPDTELDGTLEMVYEDGWDAPRLKHFLHIGTDRIELDFGGKGPRHLQTGTRVRARGKLRNGKLALRETDVAALGGSGTVTDPGGTADLASANTFGVQSTLVILFNFSDLTTQPYTTATAQSAVFTDVNNFDLENSFQQTSLTGIVRGWYTIASASTPACNYNTWASQAEAAATAAGVDLTQYPRRVFGFPQTAACNWWGLGTIGGGTVANPSRAWVNGTFNLRVVSHEMGHNFGLQHSHSNTCDSTGCVVDDYGDDHDTMGGGPSSIVGHFNAYQKERLGWLNYMASPTILTATAPGQYAIEAYATPWGGNPKALKILKLTGGGSSTYIYAEARTQFGIDGTLAPGVIIHTGVDTDGSTSNEQDLQPATTVTDFILNPGQSYTIPDAQPSSVTITTLSSDSTGAVLDVSMGCAYTLSASGQNVAATGATGSVDVSTGSSCFWTATSDSAWLTLNTGSTSGTGPATVSFTAATNPNSSARTGTLTIGGQTYTVTQAGSTCTYSISPTSQFFTSNAGTGTVNVTTPGGCNWTASSNVPTWLTITAGSSGSGSGPVSYSVASQPSAHTSRTGTLTVAGQTFTVTQEGLAAQFITPVNGSANVNTSWTFGWTNVAPPQGYVLLVGTTPGGSDIANISTSATSQLVTGMPASRLVYARLRTKWNTNQFTNADISFTTVDRLTSVTVLGAQTPSTVAAGGTAQYGAVASSSVKASFTGSAGGCTVTMSATSLPAGATATFTPSSFPSSAVDQFTLMTIATTAATPAGSYTVTVRGTESAGCGSGVTTTTAPLNVSGATSLAVATATGTYGGTVNLSATLTSSGSPVSAKSVAFTLNGASAGSAVTDASGVATVSNVAMTGINAGTYGTGVAASFAGDASFGGSSGNNSLTVNQKSVTPSVTAANKTYNNTTAATLTGCTLSGVIGGDVVSCTGGTATFASAAVGTAKTVTATGITLSGAQAGNYTLSSTSATTTANITTATVTPSVTAANKTYDNTTSATLTGCTLAGVLGADVVTCAGGAATFATAPVGTGKTVTATGITLAGAQAGNYALSSTSATTTANITTATVTPSVTATNRTYDGTAAATVSCTLTGVLGADVVTCSGSGSFASSAVGTGKTVTATGLTLAGAQAGNYALSSTTATTTANITAATVTPSVTAANKAYDGTTAATLTGCTLSGVFGADVVSCTGGTATFASATAGTAKSVTATGLSLSGAQAGNYTLSSTTAATTANITGATVAPSVTAANKVYDNTTSASITGCTLTGVIGADVVTCSAGAGTFATATVGTAKTVTATGLTLSGAQAGNYTLSSTTATTTANITTATVTPSVTAANKVYNRTTAATLTGCTLTGVLGADVVTCAGASATFGSAAVGTGKTVTATGITLSGAQAGNYALSSTTATTTANITAATVTPSVTASNKTYDGTTAASTSCTLTGVISPDTVNCGGGSANFATAAAGTGKTVTATGLTLSGGQAGNYTLSTTTATTTANITTATVTPNVTVANKLYDGTTAATINSCTVSGAVSGANVACAGTAAFDTPDAVPTPPATSTPTLIQHVSTASNYDPSELANNYKVHLADPALAGNAIILGFSHNGGPARTATISDNKGNAWVAGPSANANGTVSRVFYATGVTAGTRDITVTFDQPVYGFQAAISEFYNVAVANASDGSTGSATSQNPNISAGTIVTTGAGDLIYNYVHTNNFAGTITNVVAGSGFTLLSADRLQADAAQYQVQAAAGSITPTMTVSATNGFMNSVAIALKAASAGTAPAPGIRVVHVYHGFFLGTPATLQFPSTGNLLVFTTSFGTGNSNITAISSTPSNTWTKITQAPIQTTDPQFFYAGNAATSPAMTFAITDSAHFVQFVIYDVAGAAAAPLDVVAKATGLNSNNANIFNAPAISPTGPGLIIASLPMGNGPPIDCISAGCYFDGVTYPGEADGSTFESSDGYAHMYRAGAGPTSFDWQPASVVLPSAWWTLAASFKPQAGVSKTVNVAGLTLTGTDASNYTLSSTSATTTATITAATVTPSVTAANKAYDGATGATLTGCTLSGVIGADAVTCTGGTGTFASAAVGTAKTVTATGLSLSGAQAGNYTLSSTSATTTANITGATVTPSVTAANKTYDATTAATLSGCTLSGVIGGDVVTCTGGTATFASPAVGTGKTVTATGLTLSGAQAGNYALSSTTATTTANVTAATVTPSVTASNKPYDGTTTATIGCTLTGVLGADVVTCSGTGSFASSAVGTGKTVSASGLTLSGAQAGNYTLSTTTGTTTANITAATVTASVTAANKTYNGTTSASITGCTPSGVVGADVVTCSSGSATFVSAAVGTGKTVTATGITLSGAQAGNYSLSSTTATTTANITMATVTPSVTAANKPYDNTTTASIAGCTLTGVIGADVVTCTGGTATFATAAVGTGKTVTATGLTLAGAQAGNYTLSSTSATTTANITTTTVTPSVTATNKVYDGATTATISCSLAGVLGADVVSCSGAGSFATTAVGTGKTVTATGLTLAGAQAGNYTLSSTTATTTANITAATVTPSVTATNKVYDGATAATISCSLAGVLGADVVSCSGSGSFASTAVGTAKTVTATGLTLSGAQAGNYTLSSTTATTTANITTATVTPSVTATNKPYDGTTAATISCSLAGVLGADVVSCSGSGSFASPAAGTAKTVNATGLTLSGAQAGNYTLSSTTATTTANITAATITPSVTATNKVYDGATAATISCSLAGVLGADVVSCSGSGSFATAAVGTAKTVTAAGLTLSGAQAGNYSLSSTTATTTANITAATVTPSVTATNKAYDGATAAAISCSLSGVIGADVVTCAGTATFASPTVGTGKTVTATGLSLSGAQAGNYTLSSTTATTTANVTTCDFSVGM